MGNIISSLNCTADDYQFKIQPIISGKGFKLFEHYILEKHKNLKQINPQVFSSAVISLNCLNHKL